MQWLQMRHLAGWAREFFPRCALLAIVRRPLRMDPSALCWDRALVDRLQRFDGTIKVGLQVLSRLLGKLCFGC